MQVKCDACGAVLAPGVSQCPSCGKSVGAANSCERCENVAGVIEVDERRYQCAACGAPRAWAAGMTVRSDYADQLSRRAAVLRALGYGGLGIFGLLGATALLLGLVGRALDLSAGPWASGVGLLAWVAGYGAFRWFRKRAATVQAQCLRSRVVGELSSQPSGQSVPALAMKTRTSEANMDGLLTGLAKQGILDLHVTDDGEIRYRLPQDLPGQESDFEREQDPVSAPSRISSD